MTAHVASNFKRLAIKPLRFRLLALSLIHRRDSRFRVENRGLGFGGLEHLNFLIRWLPLTTHIVTHSLGHMMRSNTRGASSLLSLRIVTTWDFSLSEACGNTCHLGFER